MARAGRPASAAVPAYVERAARLQFSPAAIALIQGGFKRAQEGSLDQAEDAFRNALKIDPRAADAYYGLSLLALSVQKYDIARGMIEGALRLSPRSAQYYNALGRICRSEGRNDDAERSYRKALELDPGLIPARVSLGIVLRERKRLHEAIECGREALIVDPSYIEAHVNLINALRDLADIPTMKAVYESLIERHPASADLRYFYATLLLESAQGDDAKLRFAEAAALDRDLADSEAASSDLLPDGRRLETIIRFHRRIAERRPDSPEARYNLALGLRERGDLDGALAELRRAIELKPDYVPGFIGFGQALLEARKLEPAEQCFRHLLTLKQDATTGWCGLASSLLEQGRVTEAIDAVEQGLSHAPDAPEAHLVLGNCYLNQRRLDECYAAYRRAIAHGAAGQLAAAVHNLLFTLNYSDRLTGDDLVAEHRALGVRYAPIPEPAPEHENTPDPQRRLRIGYVSPDFRSHAVSLFAEPFIQHHERSAFSVICYHTYTGEPDQTTARLREHADEWVDAGRFSDHDLVHRIRADGIDILVDLAGHTGGTRLYAFAQRPAPVQMTMLGYPSTTGIPGIDYRITDWQVDPEGWEARSTETPLRLPDSYFCFRPSMSLPIGPLPAATQGHLTFGSFNNLAKVTDAAIALWCEVLHAVPGARLVLKHKGFGDPGTQRQLAERFASLGIGAERIMLLGWEERGDTHLEWYNRIDIALDTYPYNGATTTCEALWMGVPVVSLAGETHASRMGASILSAVGLSETVARSRAEYVAIATRLAANRGALERLRGGLRERVRASRLCDEAKYVRALETLFREAWVTWCARQAGEPTGDDDTARVA